MRQTRNSWSKPKGSREIMGDSPNQDAQASDHEMNWRRQSWRRHELILDHELRPGRMNCPAGKNHATGAPQYSQQPFSSGVVVAPQ